MKSTWVWAGFAAAIILMVTVGILQVKPQKTVTAAHHPLKPSIKSYKAHRPRQWSAP